MKYLISKVLLINKYINFFVIKIKPETLLVRSLTIVGLSLLLTQVAFIYIFYDNYWRDLKYSLIKNLGNNIIIVVENANKANNLMELEVLVKNTSKYTNLYPQIVELNEPPNAYKVISSNKSTRRLF